MNTAVIGAGAIGDDLALRLSEAGHDVLVADHDGPGAVASEVRSAGATAVELEGSSVAAGVVVHSLPFGSQPERVPSPADLPGGAVVVDTSNDYPSTDGRVSAVDDGTPETLWRRSSSPALS